MKKIFSIFLSLLCLAVFLFEIPSFDFADTAEAASYASTLRSAGFTDEYIDDLTALHKKYPDWNFEALITGMDLDTAVGKERKNHSQQLIEITSSNTSKKYYCTCSSCYKNGNYVIQEGSDWVSASESAVKYYMNPVNFLDEKNIFQFESTTYDSSQTISGIETILEGTWMHSAYIKYKDSSGNTVTYSPKTKYSEAILAAAKNSGMSAYYLAGKIVKEVGSTSATATGVSGTNSTYPGIYNYYSIGAASSAVNGLKWASTSSSGYYTNCSANLRESASASSTKLVTLPKGTSLTYKSTTSKQSDGYKWYKVTVTYSGTKYTGYIRSDLVDYSASDAYNRPWTNPYLSIYNGAVYIAKNLSVTQYNSYLQKFNVNPASGSKMYSNEYMANVQGPTQEAASIYKAYKSADILSSANTFIIPVFTDSSVPSTAVSLSSSSVTVNLGSTKTLKATLTPSNSTDSITWTSSDTSVATVSSSGKVKGIKAGKTTIKAKTTSGKTAKCTVTVKEIPSTSVTFGYTHKGKTKVKCTVYKSKSSSSDAIITIKSGTSVVIDKKSGSWYKVEYTKSGTTYTGYAPTSEISRTADLTIVAGQSKTVTADMTPSNATDTLTFSSDKSSVAKVNSSGKITGVKAGTTVIRVKTKSGKTDFVKVTIKKAVPAKSVSLGYTHKGTVKASKLNVRKSASTGCSVVTQISKGKSVTIVSKSGSWYKVKFTKSGKSYTGWVSTDYVTRSVDITLPVGSTSTLSSKVSPSNSNDALKYSSDKSSIAKVSSGGKITAVKTGTTYIRIKTTSGKTDFVKVKVIKAVSATSVSLGYTHKCTVNSGPLNLRKSASTSASIITTISKGKTLTIKGISKSWYKISCTLSGKSYSGYVSSQYVDLKNDITLSKGKTKSLKATMKPSGTTDTVTYKSSNSKIAKVSSKGKITAVKSGTTTIKVTTSSGKTDFVTVKVK